MADKILQNTLQNTMLGAGAPQLQATGDYNKDLDTNIRTLTSAYHPGMIGAFNQVMTSISRQAYNDRQTAEMGVLSKQFEPTQVSGNTFKDIIGFVEQNRGADISKIYGTTMQGYQASQQEIGNQLALLNAQIQKQRDQFAEVFGYYPDKWGDKERDKLKDYYEELHEWEEQQREWEEQMSLLGIESAKVGLEMDKYNLAHAGDKKSGSGAGDKAYTTALQNMLEDSFLDLTRGNDGYADPREFMELVDTWTALDPSKSKSDIIKSHEKTYLAPTEWLIAKPTDKDKQQYNASLEAAGYEPYYKDID